MPSRSYVVRRLRVRELKQSKLDKVLNTISEVGHQMRSKHAAVRRVLCLFELASGP